MPVSRLFAVRRCDSFHRFWHDVTGPLPLHRAKDVYKQLTCGGTRNTTPDDAEYFDIFVIDPLPGWQGGSPPLVRRLYPQDTTEIMGHLLGLDAHDRCSRFFRQATDTQLQTYVQDIDWDHSLLIGALCDDSIVGLAEVLLGRSVPQHHAEVAVSVESRLRGQGLGRFLVDHALDRADMAGIRRASLHFQRENRPIQRIVRALGGEVDMEDMVGLMVISEAGTGSLPIGSCRR